MNEPKKKLKEAPTRRVESDSFSESMNAQQDALVEDVVKRIEKTVQRHKDIRTVINAKGRRGTPPVAAGSPAPATI